MFLSRFKFVQELLGTLEGNGMTCSTHAPENGRHKPRPKKQRLDD